MEGFKRLEELTLMDDYMFGTVMQDPALVKPLISYILDMRIRSVSYIEPQKTMKSGFDTRGVRLDLYVEDENGVVYNVEVQTTRQRHLAKRMRYYQSAIDTHVLSPGVDYAQLRKSYVIFICNYDPYDRNRCVYRFENRCVEEPELPFGDETAKVVVNTKGSDAGISKELGEIIRYFNDGTVSGSYSRELEEAVVGVKASEERRHEYMIMMLKELEVLEKGRAEGRVEGRDGERLQNIRSLMSALKISAQEAMALLQIPPEEQEGLMSRL